MQLKRWFGDVIRERVIVEFETFTGDGEDKPLKRIGAPYEIGVNQKKFETYVRLLVTHEENDKGEVVKVEGDKPKYRTVPLHKILEDSHKRRRDLEYTQPEHLK